MVSQGESAVELNTGATDILVCFRWLARRNRLFEKCGIQRAPTYPSTARFRFGDGRLGEVRHAVDILAGVAGKKGNFTAFVLEADIPALLRKGAMEKLGGQLDFLHGSRALHPQGVKIPLGVNRMGHYILSVVDFRKDPPRSLPCLEASASCFTIAQEAPDLSDGGLHLPYTPDGPYHFEPPITFANRKAVTLGGAENCRLRGPKKIVTKLHVSWVHA